MASSEATLEEEQQRLVMRVAQAYLEALLAAAPDERWKERLQGVLTEAKQATQRFKKITVTLKGHADATEVTVAGSFNFWSPRANSLVRKGDAWVGEVEAETGRHAYKFVVDDRWILDPANPRTERDGEHTNSVLVIE